jgi:hypothetical protein
MVREQQCEDPAVVEDTERLLSLEFPGTLQQFYTLFEFLQLGPFEFVWIRTLPQIAAKLRSRWHMALNYLPILADGMGGYYCVVCAERGGSHPENFGVVVHAASRDLIEFMCLDFMEFVESRVAIARDESIS